MSQDTLIKADKIQSDSGSLSTDGSGNITANSVQVSNGTLNGVKIPNSGASATIVALSISSGNTTILRSNSGNNIAFQDNTTANMWIMGLAGKLGITANNDVFDYSGAQALRKLGPNSTTLKDAIAASTNNWVDNNGNQMNSGGAIISASTNGAKAHNYAGTLTPTLINTMLTVAGTVIWGTIGTANATITMGAAGAFTAQAILC